MDNKEVIALIVELTIEVAKLKDKVEELEKNPKVVNNYHNTYPQPSWVPLNPNVYKYDVTCGINSTNV
jgi:hypothetical protein